MDLNENGKFLAKMRKNKGMTQKQVADIIGVLPKTVSKWETGNGFPDTSLLTALSSVLEVSVESLLNGGLSINTEQAVNIKKTKFYICPFCGSFFNGSGNSKIICCGKELSPQIVQSENDNHFLTVTEGENEYVIRFNHEMTKEHYISFISYISFDRMLIIKLYPEQDAQINFPIMHGGKFYYYCNNHGLFEHNIEKKRKRTDEKPKNLTAKMSAFVRAYHSKNASNPIFNDYLAEKLLSTEEYKQIEKYIFIKEAGVSKYVNTNLAPITLSRSKFAETALANEINSGAEQYVILGSGYDTFSLRNNLPIRIFELDKKELIEDKIERINKANLKTGENTTFIPIDFKSEDLTNKLKENGFNPKKKTVFSCLGLLYYLSIEEIDLLFEKISKICSLGSSVIFDFPNNHFFTSETERVKNMIKTANAANEPMKSSFSFEELEKMLEKHNFLIYEFLNENDIENRFFNKRNDNLKAFEHINFALVVFR